MTRKKFNATISTDKIIWQTFVTWCREQDSSASEILTEFMQQSVSSGEYIKKLYEQKENVESLFRKLIKEELEERDSFWIKYLEANGILPSSNANKNTDNTGRTDRAGDQSLKYLGQSKEPHPSRDWGRRHRTTVSRNVEKERYTQGPMNMVRAQQIKESWELGAREKQSVSGDKVFSHEKETLSSNNSHSSNQTSNITTSSLSSPDVTDAAKSMIEETYPESKSNKLDMSSTDNTGSTGHDSSTDGTGNTGKNLAPTDKSAEELISDGKLKTIENLSQAKSTITRWRSGRCKMPQFIKEKYEVVGSRWKLKSQISEPD